MGVSLCGFKSRSRHQTVRRYPFQCTFEASWDDWGDVAKWTKAEVCKTSIRRFESARRLQTNPNALCYARQVAEPHCSLGVTQQYPHCLLI